MKQNIRLPSDVYLNSDLKRGGIRFHKNIIDTVVRRSLGLTFTLTAALACILWYCYFYDFKQFFPGLSFYVLAFLCGAYLVFYLGRLCWCLTMRKRLRRDPKSILCEAYAVVIFDDDGAKYSPGAFYSAILYKETGSLKPRFFSGPLIRGYSYEFCPESPARVFIHRKNPRLYTVDDESAVSLASEKKRWFKRRIGSCALNTKNYFLMADKIKKR